ncbi:linker for activation of T-cells family member 2 isoform X2 [Oxyura jamaicensis]|uniref:linker for activation of T-cells family member 2 isoform X2 n=1 Tax=Oxyura jamaicensis TaxID=8884 RepID=UPI0015A51222|nr:linker for activation of T-cells family member 2 isoform X2 [Oxyura jamaicensis]
MAQLELLWAAAALMLLGAAVSACVRCQLSATKREKKQSKQTSQLGSQQSFEVIRSHSMLAVTRRLDQIKEPENFTITRKAHEELGASCPLGFESRTEPRYQNFLTEDYVCEDAAYVEPISVDFYEHAKCFTSPYAKEEDSHSYQNVFIGDACGSELDDVDDYENSSAIHAWKIEQTSALYIESQDEEPDYVNTDPASDLTLLSKQSKLHKV